MRGINFEKNLPHQDIAVKSTVSVFENIALKNTATVDKNYVNSVFDWEFRGEYNTNIRRIQTENGIEEDPNSNSNIIDIMMETGTGKTYTYTKTIFELNKNYGIFKFIIVVPTLSIKAGTINFLKSGSSREHFKEQYGKTLQLHIVESKKSSKSKKVGFPNEVTSFVNAGNFDKKNIQVMIINSGMINSDTMQKNYDTSLFDKYNVPFDAIAATHPFMIIDEPHKFKEIKKGTWEKLQKMQPQFILRYGATFPEKEVTEKSILKGKGERKIVKDYKNLIYKLTAVDSFNRNLVKGIIGHITQFESGKNEVVKLIETNATEATFQLNNKKTVKLLKKDSLSNIHPEITDLKIESLNKSIVKLSNGLEMKKGDIINPFSYAETLQETMLKKAIQQHFELEKQLLTREVKIKPLTLFFIDNIEEYRNKEGYLRTTLEQYIKAEIEERLKTEKNTFYKEYLQKTLANISATHGGYFSKDNSEKDDAIEKEVNEILHDKEALLSLENPRRFIFSKWTLKEGWDNPNVFQICKMRSSGSEISKLQEVGRGLRLPVNEYGNRVKDEQFYLNYFVDFTETDFMDKLVNEINKKSGAISIEEVSEELTENMIKQICELYNITEEELLEKLDSENIITRTNKFKENGFEYIKANYPLIFASSVNSEKIRKSTDTKKKIKIRTEKYQELKRLWEALNEKVILEYKFNSEKDFKELITNFLKEREISLIEDSVNIKTLKTTIENERAVVNESKSIRNQEILKISTMKYSDFLTNLSNSLNINKVTLHQSIIDSKIAINDYLNPKNIRVLKEQFNTYLMSKSFDKFTVDYKKVSNCIHPTKFTDAKGNPLQEISATDIGTLFSADNVVDSYLLDELYYDSEIEKRNIQEKIEEVIVFTKIPKNSIKIPVAGGKTYSPDFAYVVKYTGGDKQLNLIVESKGVNNESDLRDEEKFKIRHAEELFKGDVKIKFKTQFNNQQIVDLINEIIEE